jgi:hypothetical protein
LRALLTSIFVRGRRYYCDDTVSMCQPLAEPVDTDANRCEPVSTDEHRFATHCPIPTRRWVAPEERAAAILEFLQGPGGRTGTIAFDELEKLHVDICLERDWEVASWTAVGRELRRLLRAEKTYEAINGRRIRVYRIPPLAARRVRIRAV